MLVKCSRPSKSAEMWLNSNWPRCSRPSPVPEVYAKRLSVSVSFVIGLHRFASTAKWSGLSFGSSFSTKAIRLGMARAIFAASSLGIRFG